jgi:hypothetical protein
VSAAEIIDVDRDPRDAARRFRRRLLRLGVPLLGVLAIVAAIAAVTFYSFARNRDAALVLSQDLIRALDERVQTEVTAFLRPAAAAVETLALTVPAGPFDSTAAAGIETLALGLLATRPQLAALFVGDADGAFLMVQRSAAGTLDTKRIEIGARGREVTWTRRAGDGTTLRIETDPRDTFDPRTRPWFTGARVSDQPHWSDVYVFFTSRRLGVTVSQRARARPETVVGGDIQLDALSAFLGSLRIGAAGQALILDATGRVIAAPHLALAGGLGERDAAPRVDELGAPLLAKAYDRVRIAGPGYRIEPIADERYIVAVSSLAAATGRDWTLMIVVPEEDFVGFVAANSRTALLLSSIVLLLVIGLAALLAAQGFATDRLAGGLARRERALADRRAALAEIAALATRVETGDRDAVVALLQTLAGATAARRASVWKLDARRGLLHCAAAFDRADRTATAGSEIRRGECPELFEALSAGEELGVADAARDPRTAALAAIYLTPLGCRSLHSIPLRHGPRVVGALWLEDRPEVADEMTADALNLGRLVAVLGGRGLADDEETAAAPAGAARTPVLAGERLAPGVGAAPSAGADALRRASIAEARRRAELRQLHRHAGAGGDRGAQVFPDCTVLVLRLGDPNALAEGDAGGGERTAGVVATFRAAVDRHGVRYVKLLSDQIVAVDGFDRAADAAAEIMAEIALMLQDACARAFVGGRAGFALGLDCGPVIGSAVGFAEEAYNVWGEPVRIAARLAATADRGTILVSESAYDRLRAHYLFRRRGAFYIEQVGELTTYVLRGRL